MRRFWPFRRRRSGRHELGAAVTGIPSAPPTRRTPTAPLLPTTAPEPPVAVPPPAAGPRVELGFRDGTLARLEPGSEQARALEELARTLVRTD